MEKVSVVGVYLEYNGKITKTEATEPVKALISEGKFRVRSEWSLW